MHPVRPLSLAKNELLFTQLKTGGGFGGVDVHRELGLGDGVILAQTVGRAFDVQPGAPVFDFGAHDAPAGNLCSQLRRVVRKERERAERSAHVGRAHAGERFLFAIGGREVGGHADDA